MGPYRPLQPATALIPIPLFLHRRLLPTCLRWTDLLSQTSHDVIHPRTPRTCRLFTGLVVASLAAACVFRFLLRVQLLEGASWAAFLFLEIYPKVRAQRVCLGLALALSLGLYRHLCGREEALPGAREQERRERRELSAKCGGRDAGGMSGTTHTSTHAHTRMACLSPALPLPPPASQVHPGSSMYDTKGWALTVRLWELVVMVLFGFTGAGFVWVGLGVAALVARAAYSLRRRRRGGGGGGGGSWSAGGSGEGGRGGGGGGSSGGSWWGSSTRRKQTSMRDLDV